MDSSYSTVTSWALFGTILGVGVWYYYPRQPQPRRSSRSQEEPPQARTARRKKHETDDKARRNTPIKASSSTANDTRSSPGPATGKKSNENLRKRKAPAQSPAAAPTYAEAVKTEAADEDDMDTKQWAESMVQTQKGYGIGTGKSKDVRLRTVKQNSALNTPEFPSDASQGDAAGDDGMTPSAAARDAGDVSDMLGAASSGPSTLRVTAPTKPQKERVQRQAKEENVETKKQRQNRQRAEEKRLQHEMEEHERRKLQENQRRTAREARGEPARNGISVTKAPAVSAWAASNSTGDGAAATSTTDSGHNAPLLDTFDAESMSSSNGGMEHSTGPTSTTSGGPAQDLASEEEQVAYAMKQSEDDSGWTTVSAAPKKIKKKTKDSSASAEPAVRNKTNVSTVNKSATGEKPSGFQALDVEYGQRTDGDPNDASSWDA